MNNRVPLYTSILTSSLLFAGLAAAQTEPAEPAPVPDAQPSEAPVAETPPEATEDVAAEATPAATEDAAAEDAAAEDAAAEAAEAAEAASEPAKESLLVKAAQLVKVYGILNPRINGASGPMASYGRQNMTAVTEAALPFTSTLPDEGRVTFQAQQSRVGLWIGKDEKVSGRVEIDFIDFFESAPTVQANPRLRIAEVYWKAGETTTLSLGQGWGLHAPVNAHGINLVGSLFRAGNTSFMRQELKLLQKFGATELGLGVGLQTSGAAPAEGPIELARVPSVAARFKVNVGDSGSVGVSGIVTSARLDPGGEEDQRALAASAAIFANLKPMATMNARFEAYLGRNVNNLFLLGLGNARLDGDVVENVDEAGGFVSVHQAIVKDVHFLYGQAGVAAVLDKEQQLPNYSLDADGNAAPGAGAGILSNITGRLGYEVRPAPRLSLHLEGYVFSTEYQLVDDHDVDGHPTVIGGTGGAMFKF